ncbi:MAG: hypothetical protein QMC36_01195 [Patescibacteria group bacterium]
MRIEDNRSYFTRTAHTGVTAKRDRVTYRCVVDGKAFEVIVHKSPESTAEKCLDKAMKIELGEMPQLKNPERVARFLYGKAAKMEAIA